MQGDALFTLYNTREILGYFDRFLKEAIYTHMVKCEWNCTGWPWDRVLQNKIYLYVNVEKCLMKNTLKMLHHQSALKI